MLNAFWAQNVCQFSACRLGELAFFVRGETLVLLLHAKRVLRVVIVLRPTLLVKFFGAQLLQVKYVRKYL